MNENPPKILAVFFHAVIQLFNVPLVQEFNDPFLQDAAALAGNDLHQRDALLDRLIYDAVKLVFNPVALVENIVKLVVFEFGLSNRAPKNRAV